MGANFEVAEYAATGSGSPAVRGVLYYENTWGAKPLREYSLEEALRLTLRALDTAAEADTATGGVDRNGRIFPVVKIITAKRASDRHRRHPARPVQRRPASGPRNRSPPACPSAEFQVAAGAKPAVLLCVRVAPSQ